MASSVFLFESGASTGFPLTVGNGGTGTSTQFTAGSVVFAGASGVYAQDNANFFWDATNHQLGIGGAPAAFSATKLTITGGDFAGIQMVANAIHQNLFFDFSHPDGDSPLQFNTFYSSAGVPGAIILSGGTNVMRLATDRMAINDLATGTHNIKAKTSAALTGTVAKAGTTTLTGTSTLFLSQVGVGDRVSVPGGGGTEVVTVTAIASNTSLTVSPTFANTASGQTGTVLPNITRWRTGAQADAMILNDLAHFGIGTVLPTALLHLGAGTAAANTAPLKLTSGTNLTTAEAGAMEYDGTNLFFTRSGTTREGVLTQSAVTTEAITSDRTVTVNIGGVTYKLLAHS